MATRRPGRPPRLHRPRQNRLNPDTAAAGSDRPQRRRIGNRSAYRGRSAGALRCASTGGQRLPPAPAAAKLHRGGQGLLAARMSGSGDCVSGSETGMPTGAAQRQKREPSSLG